MTLIKVTPDDTAGSLGRRNKWNTEAIAIDFGGAKKNFNLQ